MKWFSRQKNIERITKCTIDENKKCLNNWRLREEKKKEKSVRGGIRTHALIRGPEASTHSVSKIFNLESGALDHSATLTVDKYEYKLWLQCLPINFKRENKEKICQGWDLNSRHWG